MEFNIKTFKLTSLKIALTGSLGTFLIIGLSGCDTKCDKSIDKNCSDGSGASGSSSSFIPMMSSSTESTRSSGFFSPSSSSSISDSHGG